MHETETPSSEESRRWGIVILAALLAVGGLALWLDLAEGDRAEARVRTGTEHLYRALAFDDRGALDDAIDDFRDAASVSIFDRYPAFLLATAETLRTLEAGEPMNTVAIEQYGDALRRQRWDQARQIAENVEGDDAQTRREYMNRLVDRLEGLDER